MPSLLRYGDRNAMAFSIKNRVPFLTLPMAEFLLSLPEHYLISATGETKAVLRAAMRSILPDTVLDRRYEIEFRMNSICQRLFIRLRSPSTIRRLRVRVRQATSELAFSTIFSYDSVITLLFQIRAFPNPWPSLFSSSNAAAQYRIRCSAFDVRCSMFDVRRSR